MLLEPFFDPLKSYEENWEKGPFGAFADGEVFAPEGAPHFEIFGRKIHTPIGIPAGPLLNARFIKAALDKGFDMPMQKTLRTRAKKAHPWPNVLPVCVDGDLTLEKAAGQLTFNKSFAEPLSVTNSFGNPSYSPDLWQPDLKDAVAWAKEGQMVVASWEGTDWDNKGEAALIEDWKLGARLLKETGVGMMEMNFSCPNKGTSNLLCYDVEMSRKIAEAVKPETSGIPLAIKISFMSEDYLPEFIKALSGVVDAFSAINTIAAEVVDENGNQALPGQGRLRSGICGSCIKWAGLDMTKRLKELRDELGAKYTIISMGGVMTPEDYQEYRSAGADVVMSATGAMWNPYLAQEIKQAEVV
ncbi:MAG: dihydroorotate oxidase [Parcubacteria group bacterium Gr01-1014_30]|nr:MAG: dihydroorotate oxidase [Parcubacteria group bacterium Gr01-1014_30]